jgi:hypothetical protein
MGGDSNAGVTGFWSASLARYGVDRTDRDGDEGGDEFDCRNGEELKYEEDEDEDGVNIPGDVFGGEGRLNR